MQVKKILLLTVSLGLLSTFPTQASDSIPGTSGKVMLYSPYTRISVAPGATITYNIDLINKTKHSVNLPIRIVGLSSVWRHEMKAGGWSINQLAVLPGEKESFNLTVNVPLKVNKGNYRFGVRAGQTYLPLTLTITQKGTYQTELSTEQPNMQGNSKSDFRFNVKLKNQTADKQLYSLVSDAPIGWNVTFNVKGSQATSAQVEANAEENISVKMTPPANIEAGTYNIPVSASTGSTSAKLNLQVVVTGTFDMELTTPDGRLSNKITAGSKKKIELVIENTGSSLLNNIKLNSEKPEGWEITFDPQQVNILKAGEKTTVIATVKASRKAIPGDYIAKFEANTPEVNATAEFRIAVETSLLWGWVGVLIIVIVIGGVYYLFRKYGRR